METDADAIGRQLLERAVVLLALLSSNCLGRSSHLPFNRVDGKAPVAREQRKLAAILAADVVGYFRLMRRDEIGTKRASL